MIIFFQATMINVRDGF